MSHSHAWRPEVRIGRAGSDRVSIRVLGWLHPEAEDFWDGNWLMTPIELAVGSFRGELIASLRAGRGSSRPGRAARGSDESDMAGLTPS